jgi:hypothetical protein
MDTLMLFTYNATKFFPSSIASPPCFGRFAMNRPFLFSTVDHSITMIFPPGIHH